MSKDALGQQGNNILEDTSEIIESAQRFAYQTVDSVLVLRNWLLGKRIAEENMAGTNADRYGNQIIDKLSAALTEKYGKGFDRTSLYRYVKFYHVFPEIVATAWQQSDDETEKIVATPWQQSIRDLAVNALQPHWLSWSHYRVGETLFPQSGSVQWTN